jgi:hypothetical protein
MQHLHALMAVHIAKAGLDEYDPGKDGCNANQAGGQDLNRAMAQKLAEKTSDQEADEGQKDDCRQHERSTLHHVDVFDRDGPAVAEEDNENGKADGCFGSGHGQNEERENLSGQIVQVERERHEVEVHREQNQFHRHQDDDDVLAVDEDAEHAKREQDRPDREIVAKSNGHVRI